MNLKNITNQDLRMVGPSLNKMSVPTHAPESFKICGRNFVQIESDFAAVYEHQNSGMRIIVSVDSSPHGPLLHASISHPKRDPNWDEIKELRGVFFSEDMDVMMVLPRPELYVNVHHHCFHIWQTPVGWGIK